MFLKKLLGKGKKEELVQEELQSEMSRSIEEQAATIHEDIEQKKLQFNGMVLLHGYLQRLYVYHQFDKLMNKQEECLAQDEVVGFLNEVNQITEKFEQTKVLELTDMNRLLEILKETRKLMLVHLRAFNEVTDALDDNMRLAITAGAVYGEQHINDGIIMMGRLFDPEIEDRFMQRIPFFQERVQFINQLVEKKVNGESLIVDDILQLEQWYKDAFANKDNILPDFDVIRGFIEGKKP